MTMYLASIPVKKKVTVVSLANSSNAFLKYLDKVGISIGDKLEVLEVEVFDGSLTILRKKSSITISYEAANDILVSH